MYGRHESDLAYCLKVEKIALHCFELALVQNLDIYSNLFEQGINMKSESTSKGLDNLKETLLMQECVKQERCNACTSVGRPFVNHL